MNSSSPTHAALVPRPTWLLAAALVTAHAGPIAAAEGSPAAPLWLVTPAELHLDSGHLDANRVGTMVVRDAVVRGTIPGSDGQSARLDFTYLGPSLETATLASGEERRQVGLKLRAQDGCNVIYVMWRLAPAAGLRVQVKANPGKQTHRDCRDGGYSTLAPIRTSPVPSVREGERQSLMAWIDGRVLRVRVNGGDAWEGNLPEEALSLKGPVGLRADNGEFEIALWVAGHVDRGGRP